MSFLRALRKLLLGETLLLPIGLACAVAVAAVLTDTWPRIGGFALLAGVLVVLALSVAATSRPRR